MNIQLVSIIVPVYNVQQYLDRCIRSLVSQTYENIEILLINDGSTDDSATICHRYAMTDSRIKVFTKTNGGLSDARNYGISVASGRYYMFVDSDDYVHHMAVEKLLTAVNANNSELAISSFYIESSIGEINIVKLPLDKTVVTGVLMLEYLSRAEGWSIVPAWNKIYRSDIFDNIAFKMGKLHEDEFFIHHVLFKCSNIALCHEPLYYYVQREGSIMTTVNIVKNMDKIEAFVDRLLFYEENGLQQLVIPIIEKIIDLILEFSKLSSNNRACRTIFSKTFKTLIRRRKLICFKYRVKFMLACINFFKLSVRICQR